MAPSYAKALPGQAVADARCDDAIAGSRNPAVEVEYGTDWTVAPYPRLWPGSLHRATELSKPMEHVNQLIKVLGRVVMMDGQEWRVV